MLAAAVLPLHAQKPAASAPGAAPLEPLLPDSSNFVTASLLLASPSDVLYSCQGHCAIRLQCPTHDLDYVYTVSSNVDNPNDVISFFLKQGRVSMLAVPTADYLGEYQKDGRSVVQYDLNLTHHEKQRLWRNLDGEILQRPYAQFNYMGINCVSFCLEQLEYAIINGQLRLENTPAQLNRADGSLARFYTRRAPWAEFLFMTFMGTAADRRVSTEGRLAPELLIETLKLNPIRNDDGTLRPVLFSDQPRELLPLVKPETTTHLTPMLVFGFLLIAIVVITLLEWKGLRRLAGATDITLLALQTLLGLILLQATYMANLFEIRWNWYLIVFNPIPLILWLLFRKRRATMKRVYLCFTIILVAFIACTPLIGQLDLEHQLITAALATRTGSNYVSAQ